MGLWGAGSHTRQGGGPRRIVQGASGTEVLATGNKVDRVLVLEEALNVGAADALRRLLGAPLALPVHVDSRAIVPPCPP
eukprot:5885763-Pleurochrysis_carterae.AAC.4